MIERRKRRNTLILGLSLVLVLMGVGYASLQTVLNVSGTATTTGEWNIYIDEIEVKSKSTTAESVNAQVVGEENEGATFEVNLLKPGDFVEYEVTVVNGGNIDGVLRVSSEVEDRHKDINFTNSLTTGEILRGGESKTFTVEASYNRLATEAVKATSTYNIELVYQQYDGNPLYEEGEINTIDNGLFKVTALGEIIDYNYEEGAQISNTTAKAFNKTLTRLGSRLAKEEGPSVTIPATIEVDGQLVNVRSISTDAFKDGVKYSGYKYDYGVVAATSTETNSEYTDVRYVIIYNKNDVEVNGETLSYSEAINELFGGEKTTYVVGEDEVPEITSGYKEYFTSFEEINEYGYKAEVEEREINPVGTFEKGPYRMPLRGLDLSNAINLDYIADEAFNIYVDTENGEDTYDGLTKLTVGNNEREIELGNGVFKNAKFEVLDVYTTTFEFGNNDLENTEIENLIIRPTEGQTEIKSSIFGESGVDINNLYIEDGVTKIDTNAFKSCGIDNVTLANTIKIIKVGSFDGNSLTQVTIPEGIETLENGSFINNDFAAAEDSVIKSNKKNDIARFTMNWNSIGFVGNGPKTSNITDACFTVSGTTIKGFNSNVCNMPSELNIPGTINGVTMTSIGRQAFKNVSLSSVTLPNTITTIGNEAFANGTLTNVVLPDSLTVISGGAFSNNRLTEIKLPNSLIEIGGYAFSNDSLKSIVIPDGVTYIGAQAFRMNSLTSVIIPSSVTEIGTNAFGNQYYKNTQITMKGRTDLSGMTLGDTWSGTGTILYEP